MPNPVSPSRRTFVLSLSCIALFNFALSCAPSCAQNRFRWDYDVNGAFVTAMARDAKSGQLWFGSEDYGPFCFNPKANQNKEEIVWRDYIKAPGVGDGNAYALAIDGQGRVWSGTRNHGVSVRVGQEWRNYDALGGPLGERVFDLAVSPLDGDVWIATNRGLTRYRVAEDQWQSWTRAEGLPSDQVQAIAFSKDGTLYLGTQCDGLAIGKPADNYKAWQEVHGPLPSEAWGSFMTNSSSGAGLPSDLINDILVARDGTVYVATNHGLATSVDNGQNWFYLRGRKYADQIKGQYLRPGQKRIKTVRDEPLAPEAAENLLLEDYVTCLAEDESGVLWLGHPVEGVEARKDKGQTFLAGGIVETPDEYRLYLARKGLLLNRGQLTQAERSDYITAILPVPGQTPIIATYGAGAVQLQGDFFHEMREDFLDANPELETEVPPVAITPQKALGATVSFPAPVAPPTAGELEAWTKGLKEIIATTPAITTPVVATPATTGAVPQVADAETAMVAPLAKIVDARPNDAKTTDANEGKPAETEQKEVPSQTAIDAPSIVGQHGALVGEEWWTGGDWMGRYGQGYALLSAMGAPLDHHVVNDLGYKVEGRMGPHPYQDGKTYADQHLRHWMHRERWDDPRVLYNPQIGYRRQADADDNGEEYPLSYEGPDVWLGVRVPAGTHRVALYFFNKDGHDAANRVRDYLIELKAGHEDLLRSEASPTLGRTRVRDFWGGVYKVFTVQGPGDYYLVIRKNFSFNAIVQAVFLDQVSGPETPWKGRRDVWLGDTRFEAPSREEAKTIEAQALQSLSGAERDSVQSALNLWQASAGAYALPEMSSSQYPGRLKAYRAVHALYLKHGGSKGGIPVPTAGVVAKAETGKTPNLATTPNATLGALLRYWRWTLPLWPDEDRREFEGAMAKGWKSFNEINPEWEQYKH